MERELKKREDENELFEIRNCNDLNNGCYNWQPVGPAIISVRPLDAMRLRIEEGILLSDYVKSVKAGNCPSYLYIPNKWKNIFFEDESDHFVSPTFRAEIEMILPSMTQALKTDCSDDALKCYLSTPHGCAALLLGRHMLCGDKESRINRIFARRIMTLRVLAFGGSIAEANVEGEEEETEKGWIGSLIEKIKAFTVGAALSGYDKVKRFMKFMKDTVFNSIFGLFGLGGGYLSGLLAQVREGVYNIFSKMLSPLERIRELKDKVFQGFGTIIAGLILVIVGWAGWKFMSLVIRSMGYSNTVHININSPTMTAEGNNMENASLVISAILAILQVDRTQGLFNWFKKVTTTFAATLLLVKAAWCVFGLLPEVIRRAVDLRIRGAAAETEHRYSDWKDETNMLLGVSKIAKVVSSGSYAARVQAAMEEARHLEPLLEQKDRQIFMLLYVRLLTVYQLVVSSGDKSRRRPTPYSIHIFGAPGVGKSHLLESIVSNLGIGSGDTFYRDVSSEYWNGFMPNTKAVIYDEFLVPSTPDLGPEYLQLVSAAPFAPNMASIDTLAVGVKGTMATPTLVMTSCNSAYPVSPSVSSDALHRRRQKVIKVMIADAFADKFVNNHIDLGQFTAEQRKQFCWLKFAYLPILSHSRKAVDDNTLDWMPWTTLISQIKTHYNEYMSISKAIATELDSSQNAMSVEEIMDHYTPVGKAVSEASDKSLLELVADYFTNMTGQGSRTRRRQKKSKETVASATGSEFDTCSESSEPRNAEVDDLGPDVELVDRSLSRRPSFSEFAGTNFGVALGLHDMNGIVPSTGQLHPVYHVTINQVEQSGWAPDPETINNITQLAGRANTYYRINNVIGFVQLTQLAIGMVFVFIGLGTIIKKGISELTKPVVKSKKQQIKEDLEFQAESKGKSKPQYQPKKRTFRGEGSGDIMNNIVKITTSESTGTVYGIQVADKWILTVAHIFRNYEGPDVVVYCAGKKHVVPYQHQFARIDFENDLALINFAASKDFQSRKSICSKFINEQELSNFTTGSICVHNPVDGKIYTTGSDAKLSYQWDDEMIELQGIRYRMLGQPGFCGIPITMLSGAAAGKVLGLHVCSNQLASNPVSGATYVTREWLDGALEGIRLDEVEDVGPMMAQGPEEIDFEEVHALNHSHKLYVKNVYGYTKKFFSKVSPRMIMMHDDSKFSDEEALGIRDRFILNQDTEEWRRSLQHHYEHNGHHPEHWNGENMPHKYLLESIIDMMARTWEKSGIEEISMGELASKTNDSRFLTRYTASDREVVDQQLQKLTLVDCGIKRRISPEVALEDEITLDLTQEYPNLKTIEILDERERVHISQYSKIKASVIQSVVPWQPGKTDPILRRSDPRTRGMDPVGRGIARTLEPPQVDTDKNLAHEVAEDMLAFYKEKLSWPAGQRELSFEEAVLGIPGVLKSIDLSTSPGWPLVKNQQGRGKHEFVHITPQGTLQVATGFKELVLKWKAEFEDPKGWKNTHRWLGFVKDELTNPMKLDLCKTRIIYCGDLISNIVFRMKYGCLLAAFNSSARETPISIGLNQYSYDMQLIKNYLDEVDGPGYIAGDGRDFDTRTNREVQECTYITVIGGLMKWALGTSDLEVRRFWEHQTQSPSQMASYLFEMKSNHASGCFFTTPVNCLNHEAYWRNAFKVFCPHLSPRDHLRMKFLGDDNIVRISHEAAKYFDAVKYADYALVNLGQIYTSDEKDQELTAEFRPFDKISFLGAIPRVGVKGMWLGALKKKTIQEAILWTRDNDLSLEQVCNQMVEMASLWDEEWFNYYYSEVRGALRSLGYNLDIEMSYASLQHLVANRTTDSGQSFATIMWAEGPVAKTTGNAFVMTDEEKEIGEAIDAITNLTDFQTAVGDIGSEANRHVVTPHASGINDVSFSTRTAVESFVYRTSFEWTADQDMGEIIGSIPVPFGLLKLGSQTSPQNRQFESFIYWRGQVALAIQMNGNVFQQGIAVMYFRPGKGDQKPGALTNIPALQGRKFGPSSGFTYLLKVPYVHQRNHLNTFSGSDVDEQIGTVFFRVLAPLRAIDARSVTISVYGAFPNSDFKLPRPRGQAKRQFGKKYIESDGEKVEFVMQAEGGGSSKQDITNNYYITDVVGDITLENSDGQQGEASGPDVDVSVDAQVPMPMDKPALMSGAVPVRETFHGMSRSNGVEYSVALQLHPKALTKTYYSDFNDGMDMTRIDNLSSLWNFKETITWSSQQTRGTRLLSYNLMGMMTEIGLKAETRDATIHEKLQDMFWFWRSDVEVSFTVAKTSFHNGRLRACIGYGLDTPPEFEAATDLRNYIMDFTRDNNKSTVSIPYNASTAFMKNYQGPRMQDVHRDCSMGYFEVFVMNPLVAPATVVQEVEIIVEVRATDVRLAVPRAVGFTSSINPDFFLDIDSEMNIRRINPIPPMIAEGPVGMVTTKRPDGSILREMADDGRPVAMPAIMETPPVGEKPSLDTKPEEEQTIEGENRVVAMTKKINFRGNKPAKIRSGAHFEYCPVSLLELFRRHYPVTNTYNRVIGEQNFFDNNTSEPLYTWMMAVEALPHFDMASLYLGWKGSLKFRMMAELSEEYIMKEGTKTNYPLVTFQPDGPATPSPLDVIMLNQDLEFVTVLPPGEAPTAPYTEVDMNRRARSNAPYPLLAVENTTVFPGNRVMMDFTVPYQSIYNFQLPKQRLGWVRVFFTGAPKSIKFYQAIGDDFMMGGWRGQDKITWGFNTMEADADIAGWMMSKPSSQQKQKKN